MVEAERVFTGMGYHTVVSWTALMLGYVENGEDALALEALSQMRAEKCAPNARTFVAALKACSSLAAKEEGSKAGRWFVKTGTLEKGMDLHSQASASHQLDIFVASSLIDMYASCGCPEKSRAVFERMPQHDLVSLVSLMLGFVENGQPELALVLFSSSNHAETRFSEPCYIAAIKACTSLASNGQETKLVEVLEMGMEIHSRARGSGFDSAVYVSNTLIGFYAACETMLDARMVFERMERHSAVSWNSLILGYAENGEENLALDLYVAMEANGGLETDARSLGAALKASAVIATKEAGKDVDGRVLKTKSLDKVIALRSGAVLDIFAANSFVDLFGKCGAMVEAHRTFDRMPCHSAVSWTALALGYVENDQEKMALELFSNMQSPDALGFVAALKACIKLAEKEDGRQVCGKLVKHKSLDECMAIHAQAARTGWDRDILVATTLVDTYSTSGSVVDSRKVFDRMEFHNVVSWTALLRAHTGDGDEQISLDMFSGMEARGLSPNAVTFVAALQACSALARKQEVRKDARSGRAKTEFLEQAAALHSHAATAGFESDIFVGSSLVQLYTDCGSLVDAQGLFDRLPVHNLVLWNALLLGYAENGEASVALELFSRMQRSEEGLSLDSRSFMAALKACGTLVALEAARGIHGCVLRGGGMDKDELLLAALVDTYGKCGGMVEARHAFDSLGLVEARVEVWNALIGGYSSQGNSNLAMDLFDRMRDEKKREPNGITLASVLSACSHAGLVGRGTAIFSSMAAKFGISPRAEHYLCVIDMLSRANRLGAAVEMLEAMPFEEKKAVGWTSVLSSCKKWKNVELGKLAFESLLKMEEGRMDSASYILMAGIYKLDHRG